MLGHEAAQRATSYGGYDQAHLGPRYRLLETLGQGAMGTVYRCLDRQTGREVALKRVTRALRGDSQDLERLRTAIVHEFRLLASLRHVNIIAVRDFGFVGAERHPFFTMELLEGAQTLLEASARTDRAGRVQLLVQLLRALHYLHRRAVLHRDLKPSNILVNAHGTLKVVDFGLSVVRQNATESDTSGSLAYLAPEQLRGAAASDAGDLWAVGVLAYEMFAGHHPFDVSSPSRLIRSVLEDAPDLDALDVPPRAAAVIGELLSRDAASRPGSLVDVIVRFANAFGVDVPVETGATRDGFLHGAEFVGRRAELDRLELLLDRTAEGRGAVVVLSGESGVGKSRLVDELRVRALVDDVMVFSGQAVSEGGAPYQLWHEVLRALALAVEPSEAEAAVLAAILPDGAPDEPHTLEAESARDRLRRVVESLLTKLERPALLVLEDMHWARSDSLSLLEAVARLVASCPLLVIATCREAEGASARLGRLLEDTSERVVERMRLARLRPPEVAQLSASMLGPVGRRDDVLEFLLSETEGNPFFLVEVARVLADAAGRLDRIGTVALPAQVLPEGVKRVVERHLARVEPSARPLLQILAVYGRVVTLPMLRELAGGSDIECLLAHCADAAVLEPVGDDWRFVHDKVREALIASLPPTRLRDIHRHVALAIERVTRNPAAEAAALAVHWEQAGDSARAVQHLAVAGARSLATGAYTEAVELFERALALTAPGAPAHVDSDEQRLRRAIWERQLSQAWLGCGSPDQSRLHAERCLAALEQRVPRRGVRGASDVARELMVRLARSPVGRHVVARAVGASTSRGSQAATAQVEALRCYEALLEAHHHGGSMTAMLHASLCALNLAEALGPDRPELARAHADLAAVLALLPRRAAAERHVARAARLLAGRPGARAHSAGGPSPRPRHDHLDQLWVLQLTGFVRLVNAEWTLAEESFRELGELGRRRGIWRAWETANVALLWIDDYRGFAPLGWTAVMASAELRGDYQVLTWARLHMAERSLRDDELSDARWLLSAAAAQGRECVGAHGVTLMRALELLALQRGGEVDAALAGAVALQPTLSAWPVAQYLLTAFAAVAEVFLEALERAAQRSAREQLQIERCAQTACRDLERFARVFAFARPSAARHRAWLRALRGDSTAWSSAMRVCEAFEARPERAWCELGQARFMPRGPSRVAALEAARRSLARCGEVHGVRVAERLLGVARKRDA